MTRTKTGWLCGVTVILSMLLIAACTRKVGAFTVLSTRNVSGPLDTGARRSGEDCTISVLGIPFGSPNLESAVDHAIGHEGSEMLTDVVVSESSWSLLLIGGTCLKVTGTRAKVSDGSSAAAGEGGYFCATSTLAGGEDVSACGRGKTACVTQRDAFYAGDEMGACVAVDAVTCIDAVEASSRVARRWCTATVSSCTTREGALRADSAYRDVSACAARSGSH